MAMYPTDAKHEALYQDFVAVLGKYDLSSIEMLAVAANMVGKILAMQDQRRLSVPAAMLLVMKNIQEGNFQALAGMNKPKRSA